MELWIRSQDKTKFGKIISLEIERTTIKGNSKCDDYDVWLGHYKTKERALEVLDEIQDLLEGKIHEEHINKFDIFNGDERKVYRMPKE